MLALLRENLSNETIATRLGITERTARFHVSEILSKLGFTRREEAALWNPAERTPWWMAALSWLFKWNMVAKIAGAGLVASAAGGIGLLAWGVVTTEAPPFDREYSGAQLDENSGICRHLEGVTGQPPAVNEIVPCDDPQDDTVPGPGAGWEHCWNDAGERIDCPQSEEEVRQVGPGECVGTTGEFTTTSDNPSSPISYSARWMTDEECEEFMHGRTLTEPPSPEKPVVVCGSYSGPIPISQAECDAYAREHGEWSAGQ